MMGYGFGKKWCDLVFIVLASASSRVLVSEISKTILAQKRAMLFILTMEPLHKVI
jgi:hypothetical protein